MVVALHGIGDWWFVADDAQHGWMARQHGTVDWMAQSMALVVRWMDALPSLMVALVQWMELFGLGSTFFINGGLLAHWTAHWTGWWKNMLVCWVVEEYAYWKVVVWFFIFLCFKKWEGRGGVLAWWWCSSTWSSSTIGGGLGSSELSSWYV
uniref:Uncharacterized protein n=1 Tax=Meloidogyne enterolobii TaxID=390850 RepID=A0A6V7UFQ1_MELEN|nr:unnamed protein product [Meloidogyne enterolobii]